MHKANHLNPVRACIHTDTHHTRCISMDSKTITAAEEDVYVKKLSQRSFFHFEMSLHLDAKPWQLLVKSGPSQTHCAASPEFRDCSL